MKKIFTLLTLTVAFIGLSFGQGAFAQGLKEDMQGDGGYGAAGCGLGSMVFKSDKKASQVFAATTNGTFGNQTFGISSGTSNCTSSGLAKIEKETEMFVEVNFDRLQSDISKGEGETLNSFATLVGCEKAGTFKQTLKSNYKNLSATKNSQAFLTEVNGLISSNEELSQSCIVRG